MNDLRFALRQLAKSPGFTAVVVLSLAFGIGASATVLCWLQHFVRRPLPGVAAPQELAVLVSNQGGGGVSLTDLRDLAAPGPVFAGALASMPTSAALTLDHHLEWVDAQIVSANAFELLSGVALVLAAMSVYAVMTYAVSQRTSEFGVRIALGATPADILRQVIRQGLVLAALGAAVGIVAALGVTQLLASFLYGVSPFDPMTFLGVPLVLIMVAVLACWLPARRATRVNPIDALRAE